METYLIALTSITYAMKAQNILQAHGFSCEVQRTPKTLAAGCGYSIRVRGDLSRIVEQLNKSAIKQSGIIVLGGG